MLLKVYDACYVALFILQKKVSYLSHRLKALWNLVADFDISRHGVRTVSAHLSQHQVTFIVFGPMPRVSCATCTRKEKDQEKHGKHREGDLFVWFDHFSM